MTADHNIWCYVEHGLIIFAIVCFVVGMVLLAEDVADWWKHRRRE